MPGPVFHRDRRTELGYDAVATSPRRKSVSPILRSEDSELTATERAKLVAAGRDAPRNFSIAAWMVRRHLDYVSRFSFRSTTGDDALDEACEALVGWWSRPANFDRAGRHGLARFIRLAEARRTIDGDVGVVKLASGLVQGIEGDRIRSTHGIALPLSVAERRPVHGVILDSAAKALGYVVCRRSATSDFQPRSDSRFEFERVVSAENLSLHAHFDAGRFDQVRGVSPLATALNPLRDCYESFDYAVAKMKVAQLFGLAIYSESSEALGVPAPNTDDNSDGLADDGKYNVDFGRGPIKLELDPGDRAEFLESKSPSSEFQAFAQTIISVALKSLDIPYSFFAENFTNYSGARQALLQYEQSAQTKRDDLRLLLDDLTAWRLQLFIDEGLLPGVALADLSWQWEGAGLPWIDPVKEIEGDERAVALGVNSRQRVCKQRGVDFWDVIAELEAEQRALTAAGLPTSSGGARSQVQQVEVVGA